MYISIPLMLSNHLQVDLKINKSVGQKQAFENLS